MPMLNSCTVTVTVNPPIITQRIEQVGEEWQLSFYNAGTGKRLRECIPLIRHEWGELVLFGTSYDTVTQWMDADGRRVNMDGEPLALEDTQPLPVPYADYLPHDA